MIVFSNISKPILFWTRRFIWLAFLAALISGCTLSSSASADDWISLGAPPSGASSVIAANGSEIWVSSNEGGIYSALVTFNCESGTVCWEWEPVNTLPDYAKPIADLSTGPQTSPQCDTLNPRRPVANPNGNMIECIYSTALAGETIAEFYFALISDGTVVFMDNSGGFNPFALNSLRNSEGLLESAG